MQSTMSVRQSVYLISFGCYRVDRERKSIRSVVRLSVRPFPHYLLNLSLSVCVGHDHNSPGIEGQGQQSTLSV